MELSKPWLFFPALTIILVRTAQNDANKVQEPLKSHRHLTDKYLNKCKLKIRWEYIFSPFQFDPLTKFPVLPKSPEVLPQGNHKPHFLR